MGNQAIFKGPKSMAVGIANFKLFLPQLCNKASKTDKVSIYCVRLSEKYAGLFSWYCWAVHLETYLIRSIADFLLCNVFSHMNTGVLRERERERERERGYGVS